MSSLNLLAEPDLDWIADAVDLVQRCAGQPWRIALERLDDLQRAQQPTTPRRFSAVVGALQRVTGGRIRNARAARDARSLVLGVPALTPEDRAARMTRAAEQLEVRVAALETLLWSDLPRERAVELPYGRPSDLEVTALANVHLIQRALRRAQAVTIRMCDDAGPILRAANQRGLLASAIVGARGETVIDIVGPLALFHRTRVYGKALAELAPLLGELKDWVMELHVETQSHVYTSFVSSPVLLPEPPARLAAPPYRIARLARQLRRRAASADDHDGDALCDLVITPMPPPIVTGTTPGSAIVCPDLALTLGDRTWLVEILDCWTADHLERKLAHYAATRTEVLLCVAAAGAAADGECPAGVITYDKQPDARALLERIAG